ncbi:MAG TPA: sialidase family protein [Candidatus Acidoferrales bacterium]|nr:sialidase family protein [Candidatus Acidoferrales bacterium]
MKTRTLVALAHPRPGGRRAHGGILATLGLALSVFASACAGGAPHTARPPAALTFGAEKRLGNANRNPSAPFLRYAPNGRLYAIWTEDDSTALAAARQPVAHHHGSGKTAPSPARVALMAWSADGGETWSAPKRVNIDSEAIQGEENGPKLAFGRDGKAYAVWSIPGEKGDKTRANIRFAREDAQGNFTPAQTLNEIKDSARFPIIERAADGSLLVAWIDRRADNPMPRSLYLKRIGPSGEPIAQSYKVGEGLCECCRLGMAFGDDGKSVYIVSRDVDRKQIRNHVVRKSTDGGRTFAPPLEISDDGWQVPFCPHSGPTIGQDARGYLHVTWFTLGRSPEQAGVYYAVSQDGGRSFAPRALVHANTAPDILHTTLAVASDGAVYFAWTNLDREKKAQVFVRALASDGKTWSPVQQISRARGNASRPVAALSDDRLHVAWTETDGETARVVLRSASLVR